MATQMDVNEEQKQLSRLPDDQTLVLFLIINVLTMFSMDINLF